MLDLKLSFGKETMMKLTKKQFSELTTKNELTTDFAPAKEYDIDFNFSRLFLAFDASVSDYFFEFDAEKDIDFFINNSYLVHFFPKTGRVKLIENFDSVLHELLPQKSFYVPNIPTILKDDFSISQKIFFDKLNENAVHKFITAGNYKGQISCCKCGISGCSSEYLWAEKNIGLINFYVSSGGFSEVCLFPFKLS